MTLRVVETYASYQGEGPNTSRPTVFVRFAGCNFKCPGWPCDTQHAIQPSQFRVLQRHYDPIALAEHVLSFNTDNVCLTGGEVFLQNNTELAQFITALKGTEPAINVECFTNGSLSWGEDLPYMINDFIVDWKLFGSGEEYEPNGVLGKNLSQLESHDAIKFTIKDEADYIEAKRRYEEHIRPLEGDKPQVYAGVVWQGKWSTEELCEHMLNDDLDWRLNVQVHKFVWDANRIGV
jgi:7-carboxy-7-deazaguanine synthase